MRFPSNKKMGPAVSPVPSTPEGRASERSRQAGEVADDFRVVGRIELIEAVSCDANGALAPDDVAETVHLNHLVVELIADQGVAIPEANGARWLRRSHAAHASVGDELPGDLLRRRHFERAAVIGVGDE